MEQMKWIVTLEGDLEKVPLNVYGPYETNRKNTTGTKHEQPKGKGAKGSSVKHGTVGGYKYWKCRCQPCTTAITQYQKKFTQSQEVRDRRNAKKREKRIQERMDLEFYERQRASGE